MNPLSCINAQFIKVVVIRLVTSADSSKEHMSVKSYSEAQTVTPLTGISKKRDGLARIRAKARSYRGLGLRLVLWLRLELGLEL